MAVLDQFLCNFLRQALNDVARWLFIVLEEKDDNFCLVPRYLDQVDLGADLVEVPIQHLSFLLDSEFVVPDVHGRRTLL